MILFYFMFLITTNLPIELRRDNLCKIDTSLEANGYLEEQ